MSSSSSVTDHKHLRISLKIIAPRGFSEILTQRNKNDPCLAFLFKNLFCLAKSLITNKIFAINLCELRMNTNVALLDAAMFIRSSPDKRSKIMTFNSGVSEFIVILCLNRKFRGKLEFYRYVMNDSRSTLLFLRQWKASVHFR